MNSKTTNLQVNKNFIPISKHFDIVQFTFSTNKTITKLEKNSPFLDLKLLIFLPKVVASASFGSPDFRSRRSDSAVNKVVQQIGALPSFFFGASLDDGF